MISTALKLVLLTLKLKLNKIDVLEVTTGLFGADLLLLLLLLLFYYFS